MKSCAVLDIDATLVDMFGTYDNWNLVKNETEKAVLDRVINIECNGNFIWGSLRPHVYTFIDSCFRNFDMVGIWSAGEETYVKEITKELFLDRNLCPSFIWTKKYCVSQLDWENNLIVKQKPLSKLWKAFPEINPEQTLIFDDRSDVTSQDLLNHVWVPIWGNGYETMHKEEDFLLNLSNKLDSLSQKENYRFTSFDKL